MVGDSGGKAPQWAERFIGAEKLARVLAAMGSPFVRIGGVVEPHEVTASPARSSVTGTARSSTPGKPRNLFCAGDPLSPASVMASDVQRGIRMTGKVHF